MSNPIFDVLMPKITSFWWWIPVFVVGIAWLVIWGKARGRWCAILIILAVAVTDIATNRIVKPLVERERPCRTLAGIILRIPCAGGPSFPSSHAANMAALAVVLGAFYRRWQLIGWLSAFAVGFSRVYVGVHYPSDVVAGWILGTFCGLTVLWGSRRFYTKSAAFD